MTSVSISNISNITNNSATASGNIDKLESSNKIIQHGFVWATHKNPTINDNKNELGKKDIIGNFSSSLDGLSYATLYYIRAYIKDDEEKVYYSSQTFFTTKTQIEEYGFVWATHKNPTDNDYKVVNNVETNQVGLKFTNNLGKLFIGTIYVKAYCKNKFGVTYGNEINITFTSKGAIANTNIISRSSSEIMLKTLDADSITTDEANLKGNITGSLEIKEYGFVRSVNKNPQYNDAINTDISIDGDLSHNLNNLHYATTYYYKVFVKDNNGIIRYGQEKFFTTQTKTIECGFVWATHKKPTVNDYKVISPYQGRNFGQYVKDLGTMFIGTMYVRSYMLNKFGVTYGNEKEITFNSYGNIAKAEFLELDCADKFIFNINEPMIHINDATVKGTIKTSKQNIKEYGFIWGSSSNLTCSNGNVVNLGNTLPSKEFSYNIKGLSYATLYYYKLYVIDDKGIIYYSREKFFTTGTLIEDYGFVWSTAHNPTISDNIANNGETRKEVDIYNPLPVLRNGANYVRTYVKNKFGVTYGNELDIYVNATGKIAKLNMNSNLGSNSIVISTKYATDITYKNATITANVDKSIDIKKYGFVWAKHKQPTLSDNKIEFNKSPSKSFSHTITNLLPTTVYYYKPYIVDIQDNIHFGSEKFLETKLGASEYGFVCSVNNNPTINDIKINLGTIGNSGEISGKVLGLKPETTYYIKAYTIVANNVIYGNELTFITDKRSFNLKYKKNGNIKTITSIYYKKDGIWKMGTSLNVKVGGEWKK
ncbi:MAG: hypothetical protein N4A50_06190 [Vallitalea sp.]|jgi:hypothetical protein|nr:hypothetical protein [Vallitalea sp.]